MKPKTQSGLLNNISVMRKAIPKTVSDLSADRTRFWANKEMVEEALSKLPGNNFYPAGPEFWKELQYEDKQDVPFSEYGYQKASRPPSPIPTAEEMSSDYAYPYRPKSNSETDFESPRIRRFYEEAQVPEDDLMEFSGQNDGKPQAWSPEEYEQYRQNSKHKTLRLEDLPTREEWEKLDENYIGPYVTDSPDGPMIFWGHEIDPDREPDSTVQKRFRDAFQKTLPFGKRK